MSINETLQQAKECQSNGYIIEAQYHYEDAIKILKQIFITDEATKKKITKQIVKYKNCAAQLREQLEAQFNGGKSMKNFTITEDSTGHSYKTIFGHFLNNNIKEVLIEEPYLDKYFQHQNLIVLFELLLKKCTQLKYILVITKIIDNSIIMPLTNQLNAHNVKLHFKIENELHDRKIILSNGYKIKIGRGLHFYKKLTPTCNLGMCDFDYRNCYKTNVEITRRKGWLIAKFFGNAYFSLFT